MQRSGIVALLGCCASTCYAAAVTDARPVAAQLGEAPSIRISNGLIDATVALPDARIGFYRGTRFDWSGMITRLCVAGQRFYGPWFDQISPSVRDFTYDGEALIASTASAATGPTEEFDPADNPLGYDAANPGQSFIKIGVGVLRRPDAGKYDHYYAYDIIDHGRWHTYQSGSIGVVFVQELSDRRSGYGYRYTKRIELVEGSAQMIISHTLANRGRLPIHSTLYDHNFLTFDGHPTEKGLQLQVPFSILSDAAANDAAVSGNHLTLERTPAIHESIAFGVRGFGPDATDYRMVISSADQRAAVTVSGDHALDKLQFWSIPRVVAGEPYIHIDVPRGQLVRWNYVYDYRAQPAASATCPE
jgi:hypothetical protein